METPVENKYAEEVKTFCGEIDEVIRALDNGETIDLAKINAKITEMQKLALAKVVDDEIALKRFWADQMLKHYCEVMNEQGQSIIKEFPEGHHDKPVVQSVQDMIYASKERYDAEVALIEALHTKGLDKEYETLPRIAQPFKEIDWVE